MKVLLICAALTAVALAQDTIYRQAPRAHSPSHYQKPYEAGPPPKYPQQQYQKPEANPEEYPAAYPAEPKQPEAPKYHQEPKYPEKPKYPEPPKYQPRPAYPAVPVYPAKPHPPVYKPGPKPSAESYDYAIDEPKEPYSFGYDVKDEYDDHGRQEQSDGKVVTGSYHVALPDGRKQIVTYTADPEGFKAEVSYEGEATYPEYVPASSTYRPQHKPEYKPRP